MSRGKRKYTLADIRELNEKFAPCPFCGKKPTLVFSDEEGNWKDQDSEEYLQDPWSGLRFMIEHNSKGCPIEPYGSDPGRTFNNWYDTPEEAVEDWNNALKVHEGSNNGNDADVLDDYYVIEMPGGRLNVTRSRLRVFDQFGYHVRDHVRPLTRADIYRGRYDEAACEYAHSFMCSGFPTKYDPDRPSKEEWMSQKPFDFEVDRFLSEKLFPEDKQC